MSPIIYPRPLSSGDKIAIVSPASIINPDYVEGACRWLRERGFRPEVMPHALGQCGTYSGTTDERVADINLALDDPEVRAILCSRGGYGAVHLLDRFPIDRWVDDPRWLIGFSDISALHALLNSRGVVSAHASMCKALATRPDSPLNALLYNQLLAGDRPALRLAAHPFDRHGTPTGRLLGGNLAVISALIATPVSPMANPEETILFVEDIAEPIYKIERIFYQLHHAGILSRLAGLAIGEFTEYRPDRNHPDMATMLHNLISAFGLTCPVTFALPAGHTDTNTPLLSGAPVTLSVTPTATTLTYL